MFAYTPTPFSGQLHDAWAPAKPDSLRVVKKFCLFLLFHSTRLQTRNFIYLDTELNVVTGGQCCHQIMNIIEPWDILLAVRTVYENWQTKWVNMTTSLFVPFFWRNYTTKEMYPTLNLIVTEGLKFIEKFSFGKQAYPLKTDLSLLAWLLRLKIHRLLWITIPMISKYIT